MRLPITIRCLLILLSYALPGITLVCNAQTGPYKFSYLGPKEGLSNSSVTCAFQDHYGFMWFGTYDGLNRYDGYSFKVFRNKYDDSASLAPARIVVINEDHSGHLWVGTKEGLSVYNLLSSKFSVFSYVDYSTGGVKHFTYPVNDIKTNDEGRVFIGTAGLGLLVNDGVHPDKGRQAPLQFRNRLNPNFHVQGITFDIHHRVWLFVQGVGLCLYANGVVRPVNMQVTVATCMAADSCGNLWIGSEQGLQEYKISANRYVRSYSQATGELGSNSVTHLHTGPGGYVWAATDGGGVSIIHPATGKLDSGLSRQISGALASSAVYSIYQDKESRIWIGTLRGGINLADPNKNRFQVITSDPLKKDALNSNFILSFYEAQPGKIWIGTDGYGINLWDREGNSFVHYKHSATDPHSLSNDFVPCVKGDYLGGLWAATFGGGINKYDKATRSFKRYRCFDESGTEQLDAWTIYEDRQKDLWASFVRNGRLFRLNRKSDRFELFDPSIVDVITLAEDNEGNLWAGTFNRLIKIDRLARKNVTYEIDKPVRAIVEDRSGHFWVGTEGGGLLLMDKKTGRIIRRFTEKDGLSNNGVLNILEDDKGHLWISTFNGLNKLTPGTGGFKRYYMGDGIQGNEFNYNAAIRLKSGEFVFGGIAGFTLFNPDSVAIRSFTPAVFLTGLRVDNQPVESDLFAPGSGDAGNGTTGSGSAGNAGTIRLPYDKSTLSFDFVALEYSFPDNISYAYYLEGLDKDWNYVGKSRTANYSRIHEGHYVLKIKSTNAAGQWGKEIAVLDVVVLPPWYRSWWAYLLYIICTVSGIYLFLYYRNRQARLQYELELSRLTADKERQAADHERQVAEHERAMAEKRREIADKERETNEKRLAFFTDISHEFRTPLTLIINPLNDLIKKDEALDGGNTQELNIVYRNARRLLKLVDQLLLFRKVESESETLRVHRLDFYALCHDVYLYFLQQAKAHHIEYVFDAEDAGTGLYADFEKMEIVLYNLISNAMKFTPPGGKITVALRESAGEVEVYVSDTGPGIPADTGDKLFERFYQVKGGGTPYQVGFGIGLYLVKHFIDEHHGTITYSSESGKGTVFSFRLLKGKAHFAGLPIQESEGTSQGSIVREFPEEVMPENGSLPSMSGGQPPATGIVSDTHFMSDTQSILVVDDDPEIRNYICQVFGESYTMYEAGDAETAIRVVRKHLPDIVISDIRMNGQEDGIELCKWIKEDEALRHIPVILLTASPLASLKLKGTELGSDDYITKPFEKDLLKARVNGLLKNRSHLQHYFYNEITLQHNPLQVSEDQKGFLGDCIRIVEENLEDDQFTIKKLSEGMRMSHSNLYKRVKLISGLTVNAFIRQIKLRKSAGMLIDTDLNINEIAVHTGFNDIKYFREQFAKLFGMSPSKYRQKYRKPFQKNYKINPGGNH